MSYGSLITSVQWQLNAVFFSNSKLRGRTGLHTTISVCLLPHILPSGCNSSALHRNFREISLQRTDWSPHAGPLGSLWESFLFNFQTNGRHKCFSHCPLRSIKEILLFVSTISGILLVLYELCPPICAFQRSRLCDLCRKECCLQRGRRLIQSNPPCDFIMQGTKQIVLLSTNESSCEYCSLCCSCDEQITCVNVLKNNRGGKKNKVTLMQAPTIIVFRQ